MLERPWARDGACDCGDHNPLSTSQLLSTTGYGLKQPSPHSHTPPQKTCTHGLRFNTANISLWLPLW